MMLFLGSGKLERGTGPKTFSDKANACCYYVNGFQLTSCYVATLVNDGVANAAKRFSCRACNNVRWTVCYRCASRTPVDEVSHRYTVPLADSLPHVVRHGVLTICRRPPITKAKLHCSYFFSMPSEK